MYKDPIEYDTSNNSFLVTYAFVAAVTPFTEPLPNNDREMFKEPLPTTTGARGTDTETDRKDLRIIALRWTRV
jgi:hypothetical protein